MKKEISLAFFAQIFNLREEDLTWGIAITPQLKKQSSIALIIKNKNYYVDLEDVKLKRLYHKGYKRIKLFPATMKKNGHRYELIADTKDNCLLQISFTKRDIKNLYAGRCDISTL